MQSKTQLELVSEVQRIYDALANIERQCIEAEESRFKDPSTDPDKADWEALVSRHEGLLSNYHELILRCHHLGPLRSSTLPGVSRQQNIPERMWHYGIYRLLELMRLRLPACQDYMMSFINLAYFQIAVLCELFPDLGEVWMEALGDLGRYR